MKTSALLAAALFIPGFASAQSYCFSVKVIGHGRPVILIPGLTCTGDVWDGTVAQLKGAYQCHVLTLPGFGKQAPIDGPYLSHVRDDIIAYVKAKRLDHPAVIGHSLGGFMTYSLAETEPTLWGPMVAVDGLPFLSLVFNPKATAENMKSSGEIVAKQMSTAKPEQFRASVKGNLAQDIMDPKNVDAMNVFCRDSNQADVAEAMKELMTTDLRGDLSKIRSPFLLLGAGQQAITDALKKSFTESYSAQINGLAGAKLEMDWKARHFIMLDDPTFFYKAVKDFLASH